MQEDEIHVDSNHSLFEGLQARARQNSSFCKGGTCVGQLSFPYGLVTGRRNKSEEEIRK